MKALFIPLLFIFLIQTSNATDSHKTSCVNKFLEYFSTFFTSSQISTLADTALSQVIVHANSSKIVDAVLSAGVKILTSSQYIKGSSLLTNGMSTFGSYAAINETIQKCINGGAPVLLKLYPKIWKKVKVQTTNDTKMATGYKFADNKFQLKLCKTLVNKCKAKLTSSEWSKGTSLLKDYINFSKLGVTVS